MTFRTVLLASPIVAPEAGGADHYIRGLGPALRARHGCRVVVVTAARPGETPGRHEGPDGLPVYRLATAGRRLAVPFGLAWRYDLRRILDQEGVELVNAHAPASLLANAAAQACRGLPFVLTYHGGPARQARTATDVIRAARERNLLARTTRRAQQTICSSEHAAAEHPDLLVGRSITIAPGIDLEMFRQSPVPDQPRILFVNAADLAATADGVLSDLLRAVAELADAGLAAQLDVVGRDMVGRDATGRDAIGTAGQGLADQLGIGSKVTFHGTLTGADLAAAYRRSRVVVLPSGHPTSTTAAAEAMASGRPVVAILAEGHSPLVIDDHDGVSVQLGDPPGLATALCRVLRSSVLSGRLGRAGREHVERELSWDHQADRTAEVFQRARIPARRTGTVVVVTPYYPPKIGGVERYAERVARAVEATPGMRAAVLTTSTTGQRTSVATEQGVPVVRLGCWGCLSNTPLSPLWPIQVHRWLRRLEADVVNVHSPVPGLGDVAIAVRGRRPVVLTYHSGSMVKGRPYVDLLLRAYERYVLPGLFARARVLVAVSPGSLAAGRPGCIQITPGVETDRFTPGPAASTRPRTVAYVGRMERSSAGKGIDILLRAFAALGDLPTARLRLIGDGDAVVDLLALADHLGIADRVDFAGELTGDRLVAAVQQAAVVVLPSYMEAFGTVLAEAMACGTPVVGSAVGGIPHVIADGLTGLLVPPGDPAALAEACRTILQDGALADQFGAAGRQRAVERYAWSGLTGRYVEVFQSLLADPIGPAPRSPQALPRP